MNEMELKILELLQNNAKLTHKDIANMLGVKEVEVTKIITKLEDDKVIVRYSTIINYEKVDERNVLAWVELNVNPKAASGYDEIASEITSYKEVISVYLMSGTYDLAVKIEGKSLREVSTFVNEKLATIPSVTKTATHFIMKQYKDSGTLFEGKTDDRDIVS